MQSTCGIQKVEQVYSYRDVTVLVKCALIRKRPCCSAIFIVPVSGDSHVYGKACICVWACSIGLLLSLLLTDSWRYVDPGAGCLHTNQLGLLTLVSMMVLKGTHRLK